MNTLFSQLVISVKRLKNPTVLLAKIKTVNYTTILLQLQFKSKWPSFLNEIKKKFTRTDILELKHSTIVLVHYTSNDQFQDNW